ncbi:hypothetical protein [Chondromyces apiculatus]|uniref:STAS/SEC14 domain-containing protein n=1 Tax=Chondromyces apiculatus DSM 436 TaxID=1192034 RepID=A0A017SUL0_9BACT|nr:hypothetical protein [Chondromyces apiculatus]EYF00457.1 Hypothetical protein CAP_0826 [Chondromyces apiculatus DSM 436]
MRRISSLPPDPPDFAETAGPTSRPPPGTPNVLRFGRHTMWFEPPDLYVISLDGILRAEEILRMKELTRDRYMQASYVLNLIHLNSVGIPSPDTRKVAASDPGRAIPQVFAFVGGSFATRVVTSVVLRAANLIRPGMMTFELFDDEVEARAWIAERRREILEGSSSAPP